MKKIILFTASLFFVVSAGCQDIKGSWDGILEAGFAKLTIVIHINEKNERLSATMDSPNQNTKGIPVNTVVFENLKLNLFITALDAKYEGTMRNDTIFGTFTQSGMSFPLNLSRAKELPITELITVKPQDPKQPYPYISEELRFENKKAGITLAGTLTLPKNLPTGSKNFPAVVLVTGSGPQNRNEELLGHRPFLVLSDYLTRNGIAVLRYDDRGVGESTGNYHTATLDDFTTDAAAAIAYLKTRKDINPKKIGIIGHSEGGTIAFLLAGESAGESAGNLANKLASKSASELASKSASKKNSDLAFIVSMAGMSISGNSLLRMQRYLILKASNVSDEDIAENEAFIQRICSIIDTCPDDYILQNMDNIIAGMLPDSLKNDDKIKAAYQQAFKQSMSAGIKSIRQCDPAEALKNIICPVFALNGEKDLQVPADTNLNQIKTLVKSPVTIKKYPNLNHLFQHCNTGLHTEYSNIEETISPEVLNDIATWIKER